jgi:hypothetical protein
LARQSSPSEWKNRIVGHAVKPAKDFLANPSNWRLHPQAQADALQGSIDELGWIAEVMENVQTGNLIDGHERIVLALRKGEDTPVPVTYVDLTPDEEQTALAVFDPISALAIADKEKLDALLRETKPTEAALQQFLSELAAKEGLYTGNGQPVVEDVPEPQVDRAAELQEQWGTALEQVWILGRHRLVVGDSTDSAIREIALQGLIPSAVFTDPPYGIEYDPSWLDDVDPHRQALSSRSTLRNDDGTLDLSFLWDYKRRLVWGFPYIYDVDSTGWIVWDKQPGVEQRGIVTPIEMASTTMRQGFDMVRVMWGGYYRAAGEDRQPVPTQKPLGVYRPFIEEWTAVDDILFDPFCGSGPVLILAEELHRRCIAIELEPKFAAVTIQRWVDLTKLTPQLVES